jgi:hypothetical protein
MSDATASNSRQRPAAPTDVPDPDDWIPDTEYAPLVGVTTRTLRDWRSKGVGPPYAFWGQVAHYRRGSKAEFLKANEVRPVRSRKSA